MKSISFRDFARKTTATMKLLKREREMLVTHYRKPIAIMVDVDESNLDDTLKAMRSARRA